jgi:hypothetical protein
MDCMEAAVMLYQEFWVECDNCEVEVDTFPSIKEMVLTLRGYGWSIGDDGFDALCEDCKSL